MNDNNKQYFEHKGVKIIITEHFNDNGKSFEEILKNAITKEIATTVKV